jgi:ubiquinone/menaquinone biosynthesis C-methylase UbiE
MPFDHFDVVAGFYDRVGQFRVTEPLLEALSLSPDSLMLDVGGGAGRIAAALRGMLREVFVVDVSDGMLRHACGKGLAVVLAPAESLPFLSGSIDRIIMVDALHHVMNQRQTADELWRVLAPGGRILIIEPDIRRFLVKLIAIGEKILLMQSHFLTAEEIRSLFTDPVGRVSEYINEFNIYFIAKKGRQN